MRIWRIVGFGLSAAALLGLTLAMMHRTAGHKDIVSALPALPSKETANSGALNAVQRGLSTGVAPDDATAFASISSSEVSGLREGITLAQWTADRGQPEDWQKIPERKVQPTDWPGQECATYMKREVLPSGTSILRQIHFYPPPAPSPAIFPAMSGQPLIDTCLAGKVEVDALAASAELDHILDQAARQRLAQEYGKSVGMQSVEFWGIGGYEGADRWIHDSEIVAGYDRNGGGAFALASLPMVRELKFPHLRLYDRSAEGAKFHRAVALTGVETSISQRMNSLYDEDTAWADRLERQVNEMCKVHCEPGDLPKPTGNSWREPLLPTLQDWFAAIRTLEPGRRAAGLFAADRLLRAFEVVRPFKHFGGSKSATVEENKLREDVRGLGAAFEIPYGDDSFTYSGNWLDQAKELDRDSEGGKLALLTWLATGTVCTQDDSEGFRKIITAGEDLLNRKIDPPTAAQVHFMVGNAYSDVVAIAGGQSGANGEYDPDHYATEAVADRVKASEHYRAGLAVDNTSEDAKDAWLQAWHLGAGLLPSERYVCFGD